MNFINPPEKTPQNIMHKTFHSELMGQKIGYNIYLPPDYNESNKRYPVTYHLHGYMEDESSNIWALENVCKDRDSITVFANSTPGVNGYQDIELPIETIIVTELIPHIDAQYRTAATREARSISGWSMGGAGAFYYAVKYLDMFSSVTAYAGTYHHFYYTGYRGVGEPLEKAVELYADMIADDNCFDRDNMLRLRENAEKISSSLYIKLQIGTVDPLICDNEIMHFYLNSLRIPHEYQTIPGAAHELDKIV